MANESKTGTRNEDEDDEETDEWKLCAGDNAVDDDGGFSAKCVGRIFAAIDSVNLFTKELLP